MTCADGQLQQQISGLRLQDDVGPVGVRNNSSCDALQAGCVLRPSSGADVVGFERALLGEGPQSSGLSCAQ